MQNSIKNFIQAPISTLKNLDNIFIELSRKACNLKCKHCYIAKNPYKQEKDFIEIEKIKRTLFDIKEHKVKSIYLTGGEPLMHPDFNQILRMCLKITNVTILTNGTLINEKKARFLKKIDDESAYETVYRISFEHYEELKNDDIRGRGTFRKALSAVIGLIKYNFNPIISTTNYYNETYENLMDGFTRLFSKAGFEFEELNLKIIPKIETNDNQGEELRHIETKHVDCTNSRTIAKGGIFSCPILSGDFRARMGSDLKNFSRRQVLDTEFCQYCLKHNAHCFLNNWD